MQPPPVGRVRNRFGSAGTPTVAPPFRGPPAATRGQRAQTAAHTEPSDPRPPVPSGETTRMRTRPHPPSGRRPTSSRTSCTDLVCDGAMSFAKRPEADRGELAGALQEGVWGGPEMNRLSRCLRHNKPVKSTAIRDDDWRLGYTSDALRGATFTFADWTPPPPEWVYVDHATGITSIRHEPGPPGWSEGEEPAWDHDHCELCWQRLTNNPAYDDGEPSGWRTGEDWGSHGWVCTRCFSDFESRLDWKRAAESAAL